MAILRSGPDATACGASVAECASVAEQLSFIKDVFSGKATSALRTRALSFLRHLKFCEGIFGRNQQFFPVTKQGLFAYLRHLRDNGMMGAVKDFMQTVNFCRHVLGMSGGDALTTPWISGIVRGAQFVCKERKQSRVLTVQEVLALASVLVDGRFSLTDRCGAGCILFLLYSRARVSDVRNVSSHFADTPLITSLPLGIPLILVAPIFGLSDALGQGFRSRVHGIGLPLGGAWTGHLTGRIHSAWHQSHLCHGLQKKELARRPGMFWATAACQARRRLLRIEDLRGSGCCP